MHSLDARARLGLSGAVENSEMREANCLTLDEAYAVVLEATGDVSVLHGGKVDDRILEDVEKA